MRAALRRLLDDLEELGQTHDEVYDTDVREHMAEAIVSGLLSELGTAGDPAEFGMFSAEGNVAVRQAVEKYLSTAVPTADELGLDQRERTTAIWDAEVTSSQGTPVDEFLGWLE
jgi:transketolase